jgi:UDP-N-acetylmuramoyl-L-alanyl-D-glutamate--2,6-diaminopimelate ligase
LSQTIFEILDKKLENEKHVIVTECSSFMLHELYNIDFEYSIWLNLSIDHLNRHKNLQEYFDTKKLILEHTKKIGFVDHDIYITLEKGKEDEKG